MLMSASFISALQMSPIPTDLALMTASSYKTSLAIYIYILPSSSGEHGQATSSVYARTIKDADVPTSTRASSFEVMNEVWLLSNETNAVIQF